MDSPTVPVPARSGPVRAIVIGGLASGACDLVFAVVYYHAAVKNILHLIAAGLIGKQASFAGGFATAALGLLLHFVISTGAAAAYVFASRKLTILARHPGPMGLAYGAAVYFVMSWLVVPLSAVAGAKYPPRVDWGALVGHMVLVGLPIALATWWLAPVPPRPVRA